MKRLKQYQNQVQVIDSEINFAVSKLGFVSSDAYIMKLMQDKSELVLKIAIASIFKDKYETN